ncbi:MAG: S8 family serine peptidase [Saprospiraceae bacterium]|uniref:S8 family serine peptidase n=1 Tax=Candidatus Opimibacter skivensis TaxID=2982028 RepID=A0A9D7SSI5_9BACT|nr:S8 family serine peptidase [Candidatus Opimibacter skivensis]
MLDFIYPISYLISLTGLILWFYFKESGSISRKMSSVFLISFLIYLVTLAFTEATLAYKLLILFRDLSILAILSQLFSYVRKNSLIVFVLAIVIYGVIQFVGFSMLYDTFPQVTETINPADDQFELLVETKDGVVPKSYDMLIKKYGLIIEKPFSPVEPALSKLDEFIAIGIPDEAERDVLTIMRELRRLNGTEDVEYNETITLEENEVQASTPKVNAQHVNDPLVSGQWGWDMIQGDQVHNIMSSHPHPKKKALIAIVDSGVDGAHADLRDQYLSGGNNNDTDPLGHGTHCAGIAGAISNNGIGIASLIPDASFVQVTSLKVMNAMGIGSQIATIQGMIKAADMGADVISMSLGGLSSDTKQKAYEEAVAYCNARGAIVIAAAGNSSQNAKNYAPANAKGIITVSAIGPDQKKASFSNTVNDVQYGIAAPGVKILSTYPNGEYKELDGTSMATPMVAGLVGLLKAFRPELNTQEVYTILYDTGKLLPDGKSSGRLIQAANALEKVMD